NKPVATKRHTKHRRHIVESRNCFCASCASWWRFVVASTRFTDSRSCGGLHSLLRVLLAMLVLVFACQFVLAQQTNPVDRKVTNPLTDTPNVNPISTDQPVQQQRRPATQNAVQGVSTDQITVDSNKQSVSGPENARIFVYEGNVDVRIGTYRLQADKVTVYDAENRIVAEGSVVFDQADIQRITGTRAEWNYRTKTGYFINSTGFTNQTQDGTRIYFTADRVERD